MSGSTTTFPLISLRPVRDERKAWTALLLETRPAPTADDLGLIFGDFGLVAALDGLPCIVGLPDLDVGLAALPTPDIALVRLPDAWCADPANAGALQGLRDAGYRLAPVLPQQDELPRPEPAGKGGDASNRMLLLELLSQVVNDADDHQIEATVKRDPQLSYHLLKLVNSVAFAPTTKIASFSQAIVLLGRRQLQRWLQLLLYARARKDDMANPFLPLAAMRAGVTEALCARRGGSREMQDRAFMVGMFSLLDRLFAMPIADIVTPLNLADDATQALVDGGGPLGLSLRAAVAGEKGPGDELAAVLAEAGLSHEAWARSIIHACQWAIQISREA